MIKRAVAAAAVLAAAAGFMVLALGSSSGSSQPTYKIEFNDAFGLQKNDQFKIAGVRAGKISKLEVCAAEPSAHCTNPLDAAITVSVTQPGFGEFHQDAFCESRPESLIGEYFIDCQPGHTGPVLKPGSTIKVAHTFSTISADLLNDIMRLPYRERFTLIVNELGAAVAARSEDLQTALYRAVPALRETDNLLNLLANDSQTIQALTTNANTVITALAQNSTVVQNFIDEANRAASASATQTAAISATWRELPGFLEQLRPAMAQLGAAVDANYPVIQNLHAASGELHTLFTQLPRFDRASLVSLRCGANDPTCAGGGPTPCGQLSCPGSLGHASVVGTPAVQAAEPTVADLNRFAASTPEPAQNLAIVLRDLDDRNRAVEADARSPGGRGYTGLEALLQYVFNQALAINTFNNRGHLLTVDGFLDAMCSPYATPQTISNNLAANGPAYRRCYSWLGSNQPGVNEVDPTNPGACVPDPGGAPPGEPGPSGPLGAKCPPAGPLAYASTNQPASLAAAAAQRSPATPTALARSNTPSTPGSGPSGRGSSPPATAAPRAPAASTGGGTASTAASTAAGAGSSAASSGGGAASSAGSSTTQARQLLNYLMAP